MMFTRLAEGVVSKFMKVGQRPLGVRNGKKTKIGKKNNQHSFCYDIFGTPKKIF